MGTPVPLESPDLENDKFYRVYVDPYQDLTPATGCDQEALGRWSCCKQGVFIQLWLDGGWECSVILDPFMELCMRTGFSAQRLVAIHGPYNLLEDCIADL